MTKKSLKERLRRNNKITSTQNLDGNESSLLSEVNGDSPSCLSSRCAQDVSKNKLKCVECNRFVHYRCTQLPAYFLHLVTSKLEKYPFICSNCVDIPKQIVEIAQPEIAKLKEDIKRCENIIQARREVEKELENKSNKLKNELAELKIKLRKDPGLHTIEYLEEKFEKKLDKMAKNITEDFANKIEVLKTSAVETKKSYAKVTAANNQESLREVIKAARADQLMEDQQKKLRLKNIIIHGVVENERGENKTDTDFVRTLINDLKVKVEIKYITRLGNTKSDKIRPIKVVFTKEEEKDSVIGSLPSLKGYEEYKKISVMEDFTFEERRLIKSWADKAFDKNSKEPEGSTIVWRVRGSPKNMLFLKKFSKSRNP